MYPNPHPRSKRKIQIWNFLNGLLIFLIFLLLCAGILVAFKPEWIRLNELSTQLAEEQSKLAREELRGKQLAREVKLLQTDPEYAEMIARDKLDVVKDGETVVRLDATRPPPPAPTPTSSPSPTPKRSKDKKPSERKTP